MRVTNETDLYAPVKALLESQGYEVKAEVNDCDVVALKDSAATVIVELKLAFTLDLVLQGVNRLAVSDDVYLAVAAPETAAKRKNWRKRQRDLLKLCRLLGLGLITVDLDPNVRHPAKVLLDPKPYTPRKNKRQQTQLLTEFESRTGDPNIGGTTRTKIVTAYRQDALRCAVALQTAGEMKLADIRKQTGVANAAGIFQKNHYEWFERVNRGIYTLTPAGKLALDYYAALLPDLTKE